MKSQPNWHIHHHILTHSLPKNAYSSSIILSWARVTAGCSTATPASPNKPLTKLSIVNDQRKKVAHVWSSSSSSTSGYLIVSEFVRFKMNEHNQAGQPNQTAPQFSDGAPTLQLGSIRRQTLSQPPSLGQVQGEQPTDTLLTRERPSPYSFAHGSRSLNSTRLRKHRLLMLKRGKILNQQSTATTTSKNPEQALSVPPPITIPTLQAPSISYGQMNRKKKRSVVIGTLICLVALLGVFAFLIWGRATKAAPDVTLYRGSLQNVSQDVGGGGIIFPRQQLSLSFPAADGAFRVLAKPVE